MFFFININYFEMGGGGESSRLFSFVILVLSGTGGLVKLSNLPLYHMTALKLQPG